MGQIFSNRRTNRRTEGIAGPQLSFERIVQRVAVEARAVPRFDASDCLFLDYLDKNGYVVIKEVASKNEVKMATDLLWQFLGSDGIGMRREQPSTWTDKRFQKIGSRNNGILSFQGIQQSDFLWFIRMLPKVKNVFAGIFETEDLITSFDGANVYRPWHSSTADEHSKTECGWWHVDQGKLLHGRHAVQGLVTLRDATAETGGFCVIPGSHFHHKQLLEETQMRSDKNFIYVPPSSQILQQDQILPICQAGDLLLWDSRTVHCNTPALQDPVTQPTDQLLRAVAYVCMTPTTFASSDVLVKRQQIFELGDGTSHWPHIIPYQVDTVVQRQQIASIENIPKNQKQLIIGSSIYDSSIAND